MLKPLNNYIQIEPQTKEDFIASVDNKYNEVGIVVALDEGLTHDERGGLMVGDTVYFDSWLAAKFPDGKGGINWFVHLSNIVAYDKPVSEEHVQGGIPA